MRIRFRRFAPLFWRFVGWGDRLRGFRLGLRFLQVAAVGRIATHHSISCLNFYLRARPEMVHSAARLTSPKRKRGKVFGPSLALRARVVASRVRYSGTFYGASPEHLEHSILTKGMAALQGLAEFPWVQVPHYVRSLESSPSGSDWDRVV